MRTAYLRTPEEMAALGNVAQKREECRRLWQSNNRIHDMVNMRETRPLDFEGILGPDAREPRARSRLRSNT